MIEVFAASKSEALICKQDMPWSITASAPASVSRERISDDSWKCDHRVCSHRVTLSWPHQTVLSLAMFRSSPTISMYVAEVTKRIRPNRPIATRTCHLQQSQPSIELTGRLAFNRVDIIKAAFRHS